MAQIARRPVSQRNAILNDGHKKVLILYTGGTMGMKPDADGALAPVPGYLTEEVKRTPELPRPEMPYFGSCMPLYWRHAFYLKAISI